MIIESISQILEYVIRSQSSVGRVFNQYGQTVSSYPQKQYSGPTIAVIKNIEPRSGNQVHRTSDFENYRKEFAAGRLRRFKIGKFAKIKSRKNNRIV